MASPLLQTVSTSATDYWNDSCSIEELTYAIGHGAVGATTNPNIVLNVLNKEMHLWEDRIRAIIAEGHVRLNGKRVEKSSIEARIGDVLTLPRGEGAIALRIDSMPSRRGPPLDARACYSEI